MSTSVQAMAWKRRVYLRHERDRAASQGASRRLQAMAVNGWTIKRMALASGVSSATLYRVMEGKNPEVYRRIAGQIAAFYDCGWNVKHVDPYARRTTAWALKKGWVGPLAWDDIDNDPAPWDTWWDGISFDETRECRKCHRELLISEFYVLGLAADNPHLSYWCKDCFRAANHKAAI